MRLKKSVWVFASLLVLAGCDKVPLVRNPGEASAASPGFNRAPFVEVGSDVSIEWPTDYVQLNAVAQDDGLPSTGKLRLTWTGAPSGVSDPRPRGTRSTVLSRPTRA